MIYFVKDGAYIKIGWALDDVRRRVQSLQIGNPRQLTLLATMDGTLAEEQALHIRFMRHHVRGEWFKRGRELLDYIEGHAAPCLPDRRLEPQRRWQRKQDRNWLETFSSDTV